MDAWPKSRSLNWLEWTVDMWLTAGGQTTSSKSETKRQDELDFAAGRVIRICASVAAATQNIHCAPSLTRYKPPNIYSCVSFFIYIIRRRKIWTWKTPSATSVFFSRDVIVLLSRHGGQLWWEFAYSDNLPLYFTLYLICLIDLNWKINSFYCPV